MIICLSDLPVSMYKIQKHSYFQTRPERLIITQIKECINGPQLWKKSILWRKWGSYTLSYILRESPAQVKLILRIRPQIMWIKILAGFSKALRKWDPVKSWIWHSNLNFNLQTTWKKKMLSSGSWATNVKENKTVEFHADEDSIISAEIFLALSLHLP